MDFFNRTPTIPEDTVQYTIHLSSGFSDKTSVTTLAACIHAHVNALLQGFIWHRDAFELKVVQNLDNGQQMLEGRMRVGDCVDDEWCTVWLLKEISSKWDVAIRCAHQSKGLDHAGWLVSGLPFLILFTACLTRMESSSS